eukprot:CAMPEP_0172493534 /NCGR_PEP_ID=MMETSP1066-20121228/24979_1 /TAXON_ID=671091 /ORGANISM="Coscinodiscus wailesii, Strain CCMP2513" /LENGTH=791 /DNA_ID=CAMNT_0013263745 /DNA_START=323 /DNA_END=2698 /DNA_ORIENTATION=-
MRRRNSQNRKRRLRGTFLVVVCATAVVTLGTTFYRRGGALSLEVSTISNYGRAVVVDDDVIAGNSSSMSRSVGSGGGSGDDTNSSNGNLGIPLPRVAARDVVDHTMTMPSVVTSYGSSNSSSSSSSKPPRAQDDVMTTRCHETTDLVPPSPPYGAVVDRSPRAGGNFRPGREVFINNHDEVFYSTGSALYTGRDPCETTTERGGGVALAIGELPGYTGWFRPASPLLSSYRSVYFGPSSFVASFANDDGGSIAAAVTENDNGITSRHDTTRDGPWWSAVVHCPHAACRDVNSRFYARAYGPAVLPGVVRRIENATAVAGASLCGGTTNRTNANNDVAYEIRFRFRSAGLYTVEVVLEQGDALGLDRFPRTRSELEEREPAYEGWMLSGFPRLVQVVTGNGSKDKKPKRGGRHRHRWCSTSELATTSTAADPGDGQWIVTGKHAHGSDLLGRGTDLASSSLGSFERYKKGVASLGYCSDYVFDDCELLPSETINADDEGEDVVTACLRHESGNGNLREGGNSSLKPLNIIILGDSVAKLNTQFLVDTLKVVANEVINENQVYISFHGEFYHGIKYLIPNVKTILNKYRHRDEHRVIFFNTGLHDIDDACYNFIIPRSTPPPPPDTNDDDERQSPPTQRSGGDCLTFFKTGFRELLDVIAAYPAALKVFRTSNAGWNRWGNFGLLWSAENEQQFVKSHHSLRELNDVAVDVINDRNGADGGRGDIKVLDFYWPTLARPDQTEIGESDNRDGGAHLVHPGFSSMKLLVRMQIMMILDTFCSSYFNDVLGKTLEL